MAKAKLQGPINFAPFEDIDQASYQEMCRFRVIPFGQIRQNCEHIPYNSSKKDFFEKTGRESIEVFKYEFRLPGEDISYTVMWDYNVGLVRMTPFFKCLGYPKMLDKNPGLRDISPSVTGGAVSAQGYWMPYRCARAGTIIEATEDVERFRHGQRSRTIKAVGGVSGSLRLGGYALRGKQENQSTSTFRLPSRPQSFWTPINGSGSNFRPLAASAPSRACEAREADTLPRVDRSTVVDRSAPERNPFLEPSSFFDGPLRAETGESERNTVEKWRLKRRRRARDEPRSTPIRLTEAHRGRKPQQELEHLKAAATLVSLQRETQHVAYSPAVAVESSDDDLPERRHQKKRPKAHSF
ncbi:apses transcription factor xbp1 [Trichoderma arundinaceum]|uniref:Apses transcription factor xbp1 n=1 Tax=Trichoderma arundinaceum TaxID=490622 RepID=A0A395NMV1_TRIAR|nr:apses transcription factor xbp1 [Trichoderma arundinaceum]